MWPSPGDLRAHQVSTLTAAGLISLYTWALSWRWPLATTGEALRVGLLWLVLTLLFEVGFGQWVLKVTWRRLGMDYDLRHGRVWSLLLAWLLLLPAAIRWATS
jgi:hypothetical protein